MKWYLVICSLLVVGSLYSMEEPEEKKDKGKDKEKPSEEYVSNREMHTFPSGAGSIQGSDPLNESSPLLPRRAGTGSLASEAESEEDECYVTVSQHTYDAMLARLTALESSREVTNAWQPRVTDALRALQRDVRRQDRIIGGVITAEAIAGAMNDWSDASCSDVSGSEDESNFGGTLSILSGGEGDDVEAGEGCCVRVGGRCLAPNQLQHVQRVQHGAWIAALIAVQFFLVFAAGPIPGGKGSFENPLVGYSEAPALAFFALDRAAELIIWIAFRHPNLRRFMVELFVYVAGVTMLHQVAKGVQSVDSVSPESHNYWDRAQSDSLFYMIFYCNVTLILMVFRLFFDYISCKLHVGHWRHGH